MIRLPHDLLIYDFALCSLWFDGEGILWSVCKKGPKVGAETLTKDIDRFDKLIGKRRVCLIVDISHVPDLGADVRKKLFSYIREIAVAIAIYCQGSIQQNPCYEHLSGQSCPTEMFSESEDAHHWLRQYL